MKLTLFTLVVAVASAAPLEARDGPIDHAAMGHGAMMDGPAPKIPGIDPGVAAGYAAFMKGGMEAKKAVSIEQIEPKLRKTAKRVKITYGPFKIRGTDNKSKVGNGFSLDPSGTGWLYSIGDDFPRDITILETTSGVYDSDRAAPIDIGRGLYNHHSVFFDSTGKMAALYTCGANSRAPYLPAGVVPSAIFMASSTESSTNPYTSVDGNFNGGYYLSGASKISAMLDIVNYKPQDQEVYTISEIEYVPGKIADALPVIGSGIDIGMCADTKVSGFGIHAPKGQKQWTIKGGNVTIAQDGYILQARAHMHDGSENLVAYLNDKLICDIKALYGGPGREGKNPDGSAWVGLAGTTVCDDVIKVKKGDIVRMEAHFDTAKHPERQFEVKSEHGEGMAEIMALFTTTFALEVPGGNPRYNKIVES